MKATIAALFFFISGLTPALAQEVSDLPVKRPQRPPWEVLLSGTWLPGTDIRDSSDELFLAGEFSGGEYGIHTGEVGAEVMRYKDYRALLGAEFPLFAGGRVAVSAGYALGREFSFYEGDREDLKLDNSPLARVEANYQW